MVTEAEQARLRLIEGMVERTPGCRGIDAFTADHLTRDEITLLEPICAACDLQLLCRRYVDLERPKVGYWAGRYYGPKTLPREHSRAATPRKPRLPELPYDPARIAERRARAAGFRDAVRLGEMEDWLLVAADELDAAADEQELANAEAAA